MEVDRRLDVHLPVVDEDFRLVDDHCALVVRFRFEQFSQRRMLLVDRLMRVAEPLANLAVRQPEMVQKRYLDLPYGWCVLA
ncbi:hypothetical protein [Natrinema halophilum]|uniref:hypothetical protein n=1 Tax=Natrinema halophilum TaxID=1699371 RepID=UPI001F1E60C7|nr:hypothetical protein [Natrinema halophilum]UHQ96226.1 hypothetical protein HYG82_23295 [Natrinema halophilum]